LADMDDLLLRRVLTEGEIETGEVGPEQLHLYATIFRGT